MHVAEQGEGPLVVMCHGWPESWYSWRHQIPALADGGFHAVAPDQRGYGQTDKPDAIEAYNVLQLAGDIVGLVNAMGGKPAVVIGHDWGAPVAWHCALLRPDLFRALILLSVPYLPRTPMRPTDVMKAIARDNHFYQLYFQEPGKVEAELEADVTSSITKILYSASGDAPPSGRFPGFFPKSQRFVDGGSLPEKLPAWPSEADVDFYAGEFKRSGFRGGVNWYRNFDRNWELTPFLDGVKIQQPTLFAAGDQDLVIVMARGGFDALEANVPNLQKKALIPGAGHWTQQERPAETNKLILEFLRALPPAA
jgi:pimeloyl-ACP methyl ester carboxylesterase